MAKSILIADLYSNLGLLIAQGHGDRELWAIDEEGMEHEITGTYVATAAEDGADFIGLSILDYESDEGVYPDDPVPGCVHDWQEQPGEPPVDVCISCGATR